MKVPIRIIKDSDNDSFINKYRREQKRLAIQRHKLIKSAFISIVSLLIFFQVINILITPKVVAENTNFEITPENIERSDKLMFDHIVEEESFKVITKFEWYHDKPYWDYSQWSCGYGMRCSKNTTWITKEKSKQFVIERIKKIRDKYDLYKYDDDIEIALISFIYNIWHLPEWTDRFIKHNYINALKNKMKQYNCAWGKQLRWLIIRRNYETSLF